MDASVIEINLSAIARNMRILREMVGPHCALCPIVKADAYGLGAAAIAPALVEAGADMLAVYTPAQATELIERGIRTALLIMMPVRHLHPSPAFADALRAGQLHLTIHDAAQIDELLDLARLVDAAIPVHLEVDTGMSRGGCHPGEAPRLLERLAAAPELPLAGLFTHFASAESDPALTDRQLALFNTLLAEQSEHIGRDCLIHAANSFALLRDARYYKSMVRFGLAWAGYGPEWMRNARLDVLATRLEPVLTWTSRVIHVKTIPPGTTVGYGAAWTARRRSRIGLVPVGYADGFPLGLGATDADPRPAVVAVHTDGPDGPRRSFVPIVGAVNMDQVTIDLTDLPAPHAGSRGVDVGSVVELISPDRDAPNHLPTLARAAGTIPHELLCRLNPRITRRAVHDEPVLSIRPPRSVAAAAASAEWAIPEVTVVSRSARLHNA